MNEKWKTDKWIVSSNKQSYKWVCWRHALVQKKTRRSKKSIGKVNFISTVTSHILIKNFIFSENSNKNKWSFKTVHDIAILFLPSAIILPMFVSSAPIWQLHENSYVIIRLAQSTGAVGYWILIGYEAPKMLELWGIMRTPLLPSLQGLLWLGEVALNRVIYRVER